MEAGLDIYWLLQDRWNEIRYKLTHGVIAILRYQGDIIVVSNDLLKMNKNGAIAHGGLHTSKSYHAR